MSAGNLMYATSAPLTAPSRPPTTIASSTESQKLQPHSPYAKPKIIPVSDTMAPIDRSIPPRPDTMTISSARASMHMGTASTRDPAM